MVKSAANWQLIYDKWKAKLICKKHSNDGY